MLSKIARTALAGSMLMAPAVVFDAAQSAQAVAVYGGPITTGEVLTRSAYWVNHPVTYSQQAYAAGPDGRTYRTDCSGFVSMSWGASRSYSTRTLGEVTHRITKAELRSGDALLAVNDHVVLFIKWADAAHTKYVGREQTSTVTPTGTVERVLPYPYLRNQAAYVPIRYNSIILDRTTQPVVRPVPVPLPAPKPTTPPHTVRRLYVVKAGDTLGTIARRYSITWQSLYAANKGVIGTNPNLIRPGQVLVIPNA